MEARRGETARLARCAAQRSGPEGDAQRGKVNDRHKKTRLVRSGFNVLPQTEAGTTKQLTLGSRCDRQCKGNQRRSGSVWSKRMINVLIVVLRAVVAVSNAVIAILELIREFVD